MTGLFAIYDTMCSIRPEVATTCVGQAASAAAVLLAFAGCAVVVSHDRWFLDRVATHILAFEGDSQATWYEGSWQQYADWVRETRGVEALEPHRIRYKRLARS